MTWKELVGAVKNIATYDGKIHTFFIDKEHVHINGKHSEVYSAHIIMPDIRQTIKGRGTPEDVISELESQYIMWKDIEVN